MEDPTVNEVPDVPNPDDRPQEDTDRHTTDRTPGPALDFNESLPASIADADVAGDYDEADEDEDAESDEEDD